MSSLMEERKKEVEEERIEVARQVARFVVKTDLSQIPAQVIEKGKQCILDALGCGLYGQEFEATKIVCQLAREWDGQPEATIIGVGVKVPSAMAALTNGVAIHVADYDDSSVLFRGHPTSVVLPPVLALCERGQKSGRDRCLWCRRHSIALFLLRQLVFANRNSCEMKNGSIHFSDNQWTVNQTLR